MPSNIAFVKFAFAIFGPFVSGSTGPGSYPGATLMRYNRVIAGSTVSRKSLNCKQIMEFRVEMGISGYEPIN